MDYRKILWDAMGTKGYVLAADLAICIGNKSDCSRAHAVYKRMCENIGELLKYKKGTHQLSPSAYVRPDSASAFESRYPDFNRQ